MVIFNMAPAALGAIIWQHKWKPYLMAPVPVGAIATTLFSQPTVTRPSICGGTHYLFSHYLHYQQYIVNIILPILEKIHDLFSLHLVKFLCTVCALWISRNTIQNSDNEGLGAMQTKQLFFVNKMVVNKG